ncbi:hypothetical protein FA15DRAFT_704907 [Coprinopsis marcescibilis]|uniref:F-box domain-containing protein n=1 Tax=Coprinopsis marcescibilis TaxID=230819 RepID=A0A5C3KW16_COPMA|nr:hypothetical protein FA15DRAFT_704907 [Coprinopsis marcescibilis]
MLVESGCVWKQLIIFDEGVGLQLQSYTPDWSLPTVKELTCAKAQFETEIKFPNLQSFGSFPDITPGFSRYNVPPVLRFQHQNIRSLHLFLFKRTYRLDIHILPLMPALEELVLQHIGGTPLSPTDGRVRDNPITHDRLEKVVLVSSFHTSVLVGLRLPSLALFRMVGMPQPDHATISQLLKTSLQPNITVSLEDCPWEIGLMEYLVEVDTAEVKTQLRAHLLNLDRIGHHWQHHAFKGYDIFPAAIKTIVCRDAAPTSSYTPWLEHLVQWYTQEGGREIDIYHPTTPPSTHNDNLKTQLREIGIHFHDCSPSKIAHMLEYDLIGHHRIRTPQDSTMSVLW